jgi:hypothetical protein
MAKALCDELLVLAEEKGSVFWKAVGMLRRASLLALAGKASDAEHVHLSCRQCALTSEDRSVAPRRAVRRLSGRLVADLPRYAVAADGAARAD